MRIIKFIFVVSALLISFLPSLAFCDSSEWEQVEKKFLKIAESANWEEAEKKALIISDSIKVETKSSKKNIEKGLRDNESSVFKKDSRELVLPSSSVKKHTLEVSYSVSNYKYEEPGLMKDKGTMQGLNASYIFRPDQNNILHNKFINTFHLEAAYNFIPGHAKYEGGYSNGLITNSLDVKLNDYSIWDARSLLGKEFVTNGTFSEMYTGFGWRYLNDEPPVPYNVVDQGNTVIMYQREQWYYYMPFGVNVTHKFSPKYKLSLNAEYDWMFYGHNISNMTSAYNYLGVLGGDKLEFYQHHGHGYRGSIEFSTVGKYVEFFIRPYVEYWWLARSTINSGFVEPENNTFQFGSKIGIRF
ncbi:MAG: hypothetical protein HQL25_08000 [Candidatus Omnitrophica bacterium]|nr:hypothetical protein [Candidatus Omnitrophota bacterium]